MAALQSGDTSYTLSKIIYSALAFTISVIVGLIVFQFRDLKEHVSRAEAGLQAVREEQIRIGGRIERLEGAIERIIKDIDRGYYDSVGRRREREGDDK